MFSRCYPPNYGQSCEFQIDCIILKEKFYEITDQKETLYQLV
jgi:hypothetical protein